MRLQDLSESRPLRIDLFRDMAQFARNELGRYYDVAGIDDRRILQHWYKFQRRTVPAKPRIIYKAFDFSCPPEHTGGLAQIENDIIYGKDLTRYLSTRLEDITFQDRVLDVSQIYHFHLGVGPRSNAKGQLNPITNARIPMVERTDDLLMLWITDEAAYFIAIVDHNRWC